MDKNARYENSKFVTVETSDYVILSFQMNTNYVEEAYKQLEKKCSGRISQVTTEHLTSFKFLSYDQKVVLRGLCSK